MYYLGIDPGANGGIAVISEHGIEVQPYSDGALQTVAQSLTGENVRCCLEQVHSMPGQGVRSVFQFGESYGYIKGVLEARKISYQEISPQRWKAEYGLKFGKDTPKAEIKAASIAVCKRLFPAVELRATPRCRTDHDGMAEALLMAEYARRKL